MDDERDNVLDESPLTDLEQDGLDGRTRVCEALLWETTRSVAITSHLSVGSQDGERMPTLNQQRPRCSTAEAPRRGVRVLSVGTAQLRSNLR
jgi:hypothetical protein